MNKKLATSLLVLPFFLTGCLKTTYKTVRADGLKQPPGSSVVLTGNKAIDVKNCMKRASNVVTDQSLRDQTDAFKAKNDTIYTNKELFSAFRTSIDNHFEKECERYPAAFSDFNNVVHMNAHVTATSYSTDQIFNYQDINNVEIKVPNSTRRLNPDGCHQ